MNNISQNTKGSEIQNLAYRFINSNAKRPNQILKEKPVYGGIPFFLPIDDAFKVIELTMKCEISVFFKKNKKHLSGLVRARKLADFKPYAEKHSMDLMVEKFIMAPYLIPVMKAEKMRMLCVDEETAYYAKMLAMAHMHASLCKEFVDYLPDGEARLLSIQQACLLLFSRTPGCLTKEFWDNLPSERGKLLILKSNRVRKKALREMNLYIGMKSDNSSNLALLAPNEGTAKKMFEAHNSNDTIDKYCND